MSILDQYPDDAIAVIGMSCRFPGANSPAEFWDVLANGKDTITHFSHEDLVANGVSEQLLNNPNFVPAKGVCEAADCFDAEFFGISPHEAKLMDPQQRVFLECAWAAFEDAGYKSDQIDGPVGVFGGSILSTYLLRNIWPNKKMAAEVGSFQMAVGNDPTFLATRTSYLLDLKGPSVTVGTACSTSLVAVHMACQSLIAFESDMALAGGVSIHLPLEAGYVYDPGSILSPDGHCRPFDAAARGTVSSDGAGTVVLKRLEDAVNDGDTIHAVICGSAINNDGSEKVGFTAPSVKPQVKVITEAMTIADIAPESLTFIEAHAAGTPIGDPIEVSALAEVFGDVSRAYPCAIGSVKSNIGHVDAASGIAGFIKAVLCLKHRQIAPSVHYEKPNPAINFGSASFYVPTSLVDHNPAHGPMRAGVSSFGIGGTNAHIILQEPPVIEPVNVSQDMAILKVSGRTENAVDEAILNLGQFCKDEPNTNLSDMCFTLANGRAAYKHRRFIVGNDLDTVAEALLGHPVKALAGGDVQDEDLDVTFMFPGLGDHYPNMGWELYCTEPVFRKTVDSCSEAFNQHFDGDFRDRLFAGKDWKSLKLTQETGTGKLDFKAMLSRGKETASSIDPIDLPTNGQPAIFTIEFALAQLLISWGLNPTAMIGYSIGEFVAAAVSNVFSIGEAISIVAERAKLIEAHVAPGAMLAVPLGEVDLSEHLTGDLSVAALNGPKMTIVSGGIEAIDDLRTRLSAQDVSHQTLKSTYAYHSHMLEPIVHDLAAIVSKHSPQTPRIPYVSCLTGNWISDQEATSPEYWANHLCNTVRFQDGLATLLSKENHILLEVGPGQSLTAQALSARARLQTQHPVVPLMRWSYSAHSEHETILNAQGNLWARGVEFNSTEASAPALRCRISLPTYPFQRQRYWINPPSKTAIDEELETGRNPLHDWFYLPYWKPSVVTLRDGPAQNWLIFSDEAGVGKRLAAELSNHALNVVIVGFGNDFQKTDTGYNLDPSSSADLAQLFECLKGEDVFPDQIVHCLACEDGQSDFNLIQSRGFHSVCALVRASSKAEPGHKMTVNVVGSNLFDTSGGQHICPAKTTIVGGVLVAQQEYPDIDCRVIDLDSVEPHGLNNSVLLTEVLSNFREPLIAFRRGRRLVQKFEQVSLDQPKPNQSRLRHNGTYLITGGLGGVGLAMARFLAKTHQANLVLLGRSEMPNKMDWDAWITQHGINDPTSRKIVQVQELEQLGSQVLTLSADVADAGSMADAITSLTEKFGPLSGIFHCAGAIGAETFQEIKSTGSADANKQFHAKVHGTDLLGDIVKTLPKLDFCVLMSSLASVLGGLGFASYAAANIYLDSFAAEQNKKGETPWFSINWDSWRLEGVHRALEGVGGTVSGFYMEEDEAADACSRILGLGYASQVVVSSGNLNARLAQWVLWHKTSNEVTEVFDRPNISSVFVAPRGDLEEKLAKIWIELFSIDRIGAHDNFFELGGHSLLATQLNARISGQLGYELTLATVLLAPSVAQLASVIIEQELEKTDSDTLDQLIDEVGGMTEQELEQLLAEEEVR
ncbi:MAG: phthiocerol/phenolphthiocerol synthesis type-I polyketide synthase E [Candidatus Azotimanducaceae bacterium]|jgi:phthiocerol/phenolphthiocerol synthesis type-I polyketide synthase E